MRAIFISYRRSDSEGEAGRISDLLTSRFSDESVFMDVDSIQPGRDFRKAIDESIQACSVVLTLIGPNWLEAHDECGGRRLDAPNDYVRLEIAAALRRDIPVIPVLLRGARMPHDDQLPGEIRDLAFRNSVELTHARWKSDMQVLTEALEALLGAAPAPAPAGFARAPAPEPRPAPRPAAYPVAPQPQMAAAAPQQHLSPSQRAAEHSRLVSPNRNIDTVVHPYRPAAQPPRTEPRPSAQAAPAHHAPVLHAPAHPVQAYIPPLQPVPAVIAQPVPAPAAPVAAGSGGVPDASAEKITKHLAHFIGPIAEIVVKRAARRAASVEELASTVAAEIESTAERTKFLGLCGQ